MNCPKCQNVMKSGRSRILANPIGKAFIGLAQEHLWFHPDDAQAEKVLEAKTEYPTNRCTGCGLIVIETVRE